MDVALKKESKSVVQSQERKLAPLNSGSENVIVFLKLYQCGLITKEKRSISFLKLKHWQGRSVGQGQSQQAPVCLHIIWRVTLQKVCRSVLLTAFKMIKF